MPGIPVHDLLHRDGHQRRDERGKTRHGLSPAAGADHVHRPPADQNAGHRKQDSENDRRHALKALMSVGVFPIRCAAGELHADDDDEAAEHIRGRVHCVADHGPGVGQNADKKLSQ